jgi:hypothetical protein
MREIVARKFQRIGLVAAVTSASCASAVKGRVRSNQFAIHLRRKRGLGEAGADGGGDVRRGAAGRNFA